MKKIIAIALCVVLLLCGCAGNAPAGNDDQTPGGSNSGLTGNDKPNTDLIGGNTEPEKLTTAVALKYAHCYDSKINRRIALNENGTPYVFVANGYSDHENAKQWTNLKGVEISAEVLYGVKKDGSLVVLTPAITLNKLNWDYSAFTDLIQVESAHNHAIYGLKSDGTVVATGDKAHDVSDWTDIVLLSAGGDSNNMIMGLKADGTVVIEGDDAVLGAAQWTDIVHISAGRFHAAGVKSDGTVVTVGRPYKAEDGDKGEFDVSGWTDIVYVAAENQTTYGLKSDGTVVCTGYNAKDSYAEWKDIICIYPSFNAIVGLKADGVLTYQSSWVVFEP